MEKFPKYYLSPTVPDLTRNQFREKLPVKQAMYLDTLIKDYYRREMVRLNYDDETIKRFLGGR